MRKAKRESGIGTRDSVPVALSRTPNPESRIPTRKAHVERNTTETQIQAVDRHIPEVAVGRRPAIQGWSNRAAFTLHLMANDAGFALEELPATSWIGRQNKPFGARRRGDLPNVSSQVIHFPALKFGPGQPELFHPISHRRSMIPQCLSPEERCIHAGHMRQVWPDTAADAVHRVAFDAALLSK